MPEPSDRSLLVLVLDGVYRQPCAKRVVRRLERLPGVSSVSIHLQTHTAFIEYQPSAVSAGQMHQAIKEAGYGVLAQTDRHSTDPALALLAVQNELARYRTRTVAAVLLWAAFVFTDAFQFSVYSLWMLATALVLWCASHFHRGALRALKTLSPDLNLLVSVSSLLIYLQGTAASVARFMSLDQPYHTYWAQLAAIVALTNFGLLLEKQALSSQARALYNLLSAFPKLARKMVNGREEVSDAESVRAGELLSVRAGEQIPADGTVQEGVSSVDESLITGAAALCRKMPDDRVWGGTHNKTGRLLVKSSAAASGMLFSKSIAAVWRRQAERPAPPSMTDTAALIALPVLCALAAFAAYPAFNQNAPWLATALAALEKAASVLAAGTPATLALAAPLAFLFAYDRGDKESLVLQNPAVIERADIINALALEQTGVITHGKLAIAGCFPSSPSDEPTLLRYAMIALGESGLPSALAVTALAKSRKTAYPQADSSEFFPGKGLKARYGTETVMAGTLDWLMAEGVILPEGIEDKCAQQTGVAVNSRFLGHFRFSDSLRPSSREAVAEARRAGIEPMIVSCEPEGHVTACALDIGIKRRVCEVPPEKRASVIEQLRKEGLRTAVLGAGLLDAQAMSCGEAGISASADSPLEPLYADIALRTPDFSSALRALLLLRRAKTTLRRNLMIALFFSALLILPGSGLFEWPEKQETMLAIYLSVTLFAVAALAANSYLLRRVKLS